MRFEIGPGGALVLMLGLAGLSGGVFYLGLVAGTEMSRQEQIEPEHADLMPLPSPPAAEATPARAAPPNSLAPGTGSMASGPPAGSPPGARPSSPASPGLAASPPGGGTSPPEIASKTNGAGGEEEGEANPSKAPAPAAPKASAAPTNKRQPYSVQIEAVMDREGAEDLVGKLKSKGFDPYIVQTEMNGQTWYRVRVGHYSTPDEAADAQNKLHEQFAGAFTTH